MNDDGSLTSDYNFEVHWNTYDGNPTKNEVDLF